MPERKLFEKKDILLFLALAILGLVAFSSHMPNVGETAQAQISVNGHIVANVSLSKEQKFVLPENPNISFDVHDGAIAFIESNCPDKVCINSGFLSHVGQAAVCLPNRVSLVIVKTNGVDDIDAVIN